MSTAPCWIREVVWTRTEAAARARLDADHAYMSTAPSRRREVNGRLRDLDLDLHPGQLQRRAVRRLPKDTPPCSSFPSFPSFHSLSAFPLHPHKLHAHSLTSRGIMMGLLVKNKKATR